MQKILCKNLKTDPNLKKTFTELENHLLAHQGLDAFDEIIKIVLTKLFDEKINLGIFPGIDYKYPNKEVEFKIYENDDETYDRINHLFEKSKKNWPGIFKNETKINVKSQLLHYCVLKIEKISISSSELDSLGEAFEALINPRIKGEKGQYFTPHQVVKMAVNMINPKINERILDPACGSGAFLIESINKIIRENRSANIEEKIVAFVKNNVYGIDFDSRLVKIARSYMIIFGSGENNIHLVDSLNIEGWNEKEKQEISNFDIIITNPPFAGRITDQNILKYYELSQQTHVKKGFSKKITRDLLFLERCINLLKEGGRLGIILPHGIANNKSLLYVREFLFQKGEILAVVSFDENMFRPYTSAKTCFLLFKKTKMPKNDYSIFFAISDKSGKDTRGNYIITSQSDNNELKITIGGTVGYIDSDIFEIGQQYLESSNV